MSLPTNIPSLPYLTRPRHKHSSSITLINAPSTPKEFTSFSPISRLLDSPKQIALPKVTRASFFSKSNLPSPTGQETRSRSRGFMGTTLQEIAPDEAGMQKDSPKRRTVKFEVVQDLGQPPVDNQKREDCNERLRTICACLAEIGEIRRSRMKEDNPYFRKDSEKLAKLIEEAFLAMGIQLKEMRNSIVDSAMLIEPIEEEQDLSSFYYMLIQEISEFPYTCLSKLKIRMISVCNDIDLCSPSYTQIMKQKINNGLFVLRQLPNREAIREHWYKVVLYHLVKAQPRFFMKWKETFGMFISKKGEADELLQTLKCLLRPDKSSKLGLFQAEEKIKFLKNELEKFEPMMFDEEWCIFKKKEQIF